MYLHTNHFDCKNIKQCENCEKKKKINLDKNNYRKTMVVDFRLDHTRSA